MTASTPALRTMSRASQGFLVKVLPSESLADDLAALLGCQLLAIEFNEQLCDPGVVLMPFTALMMTSRDVAAMPAGDRLRSVMSSIMSGFV